MKTLCHFASASKFIYAYVVDCVFVIGVVVRMSTLNIVTRECHDKNIHRMKNKNT